MIITTTARHFEASPELVKHIEERIGKLKRYFDHILNVSIGSIEIFCDIGLEKRLQ